MKAKTKNENEDTSESQGSQESFEYEEIDKKPEEDQIRESYQKRAEDKKENTGASKTESGTGSQNTEKSPDYDTLGDLIIDIGNSIILPDRYVAPYDKFTDKEEERIRRYAKKVEEKYPQAHGALSGYPEAGLGLTLVMAGMERRAYAKVKTDKKEG